MTNNDYTSSNSATFAQQQAAPPVA